MPPFKAYWSAEAIGLIVAEVLAGAAADWLDPCDAIALRFAVMERFRPTRPVVDLTPDDGDDEPILLTPAPPGAA